MIRLLDWLAEVIDKLRARIKARHEKHICHDRALQFLPLFAISLGQALGVRLPLSLFVNLEKSRNPAQLILISAGKLSDEIGPDA